MLLDLTYSHDLESMKDILYAQTRKEVNGTMAVICGLAFISVANGFFEGFLNKFNLQTPPT